MFRVHEIGPAPMAYSREVVGFAVWDSNGKGIFGPTGVAESERGKGIGKAILLASMYAMKQDGYRYAIIGGAGKKPQGFYEKVLGAKVI